MFLSVFLLLCSPLSNKCCSGTGALAPLLIPPLQVVHLSSHPYSPPGTSSYSGASTSPHPRPNPRRSPPPTILISASQLLPGRLQPHVCPLMGSPSVLIKSALCFVFPLLNTCRLGFTPSPHSDVSVRSLLTFLAVLKPHSPPYLGQSCEVASLSMTVFLFFISNVSILRVETYLTPLVTLMVLAPWLVLNKY